MKVRLLTLLAITVALLGVMAFTAHPASADGGPHRQRTSLANLTSCGECHRAHTAEGPKILAADNAYDLCMTCHGTNGTVGQNVQDGWYRGTTGAGPLKGGGFEHVTMNNTYSTTAPSMVAATSQHQVVGFGTYTSDTVWGFGDLNSGPGLANFALQCSTCHDPHGGSGVNATGGRAATYRILRRDIGNKLNGSTGAIVAQVNDTAGHKYTITDLTTDIYYGQTYSSVNDTTGTDNNLMLSINTWCATCHTRIHAPAGSNPANTSSGDAIFNFRHPTDGNNVSFNFNPNNPAVNDPGAAPGCFTCHVSHGSNASLLSSRGSALNVPVPGGTEATGPYLDSTLLRLDGRATCEACHNK